MAASRTAVAQVVSGKPGIKAGEYRQICEYGAHNLNRNDERAFGEQRMVVNRKP
jgi:hypothetical protein